MRIGERVKVRGLGDAEGLVIWFHDWHQDVWLVQIQGYTMEGTWVRESEMKVISGDYRNR